MRILTLFLDGIGLGANDQETNPFAIANTPTMFNLANGYRWLADTGTQRSDEAVFLPTDARLALTGRPQSGNRASELAHRSQCVANHRSTLRSETRGANTSYHRGTQLFPAAGREREVGTIIDRVSATAPSGF